jgi:tetratricopeptide (TPR) repeat protein
MVFISVRSNNLWWMAMPAVACFVVLTLPFGLGRVPALASLLVYSGLIGAQIMAIILTQSRGPWIGLAAGLVCFAVLLALRWRRRRLLRNALIVALPLAILLVVFNLPIAALKPARDLPYLGRLGTLTEVDSGTGKVRWLIWQGSLELITTRPDPGLQPDGLAWTRPFLGYGPDAMSLVVNKVYQPGLGGLEARNASPDRNHLNLLDHLVMTGIFGLATYLALVGVGLHQGWRTLRQASTPASQLIVVGLVSALVAHLVESQVGIVIVATWTYFWVYLAILGGAAVWVAGAQIEDQPGKVPFAPSNVPIHTPPGSSRRRDRRQATASPSPSPAVQVPSPKRWVWFLMFVALCWVISLVVSGGAPNDDVPVTMLTLFIVTVVGMMAGAVFLASQSQGSLAPAFWSGPFSAALPAIIGAFVLLGATNITLDGVSADVFYKRGTGAEQAGQFPSAIQYYQRALRLQPDQDWYYIFFGRALLGLAEQRPTPAPGAAPIRVTAAQILAMDTFRITGLGKLDALEAARVIFERARALNPLNPDHYANIGRLERYWAQTIDPSHIDAAVAAFEQAVTVSPRTPHLQNELARAYIIRGEIDKAEEVARNSLQLDPGFAATQALLGDIYLYQKRWDDALAAHGQALLLDPSILADQDAEKRILTYIDAGKLDQLMEVCQQAVEKNPRNAALRSTYAYVLTKAGRTQEALVQYQVNLSIAPNDWVAYRNVAVTYQILGRIPEAITATQSAIQYAPEAQRKPLQDFLAQLQSMRKP